MLYLSMMILFFFFFHSLYSKQSEINVKKKNFFFFFHSLYSKHSEIHVKKKNFFFFLIMCRVSIVLNSFLVFILLRK